MRILIARLHRALSIFGMLAIIAVTLAGCDQRAWIDKAAPEEELAFAKQFIALLQQRDFLEIAAQFEPEALQGVRFDLVPDLADRVPAGPPVAITLEGFNIARRADIRLTSLTLEYEFSKQWLVVELVVVKKSDGPPMVRAIRLTPLNAPLRAVNAFRLEGKPIEAYLVAGATLAVIAFIGTSLIVCMATTRLRWWWRIAWCVAMFIGLGHVLVEWTGGQVSGKLSTISFFSFSIGRLGPDGPYYFETVIPIGALAFWWWRRNRKITPPSTAADQATQFD